MFNIFSSHKQTEPFAETNIRSNNDDSKEEGEPTKAAPFSSDPVPVEDKPRCTEAPHPQTGLWERLTSGQK